MYIQKLHKRNLYIFLIISLIVAEKNIVAAEAISIFQQLKKLIKDDKIEEFNSLVTTKREHINHQDKLGITLLMYAASEGKIAFVRLLIGLGADIKLLNDFPKDRTAFDIAILRGFDDIAKLLK